MEPRTLVLDIGQHTCKAGYAGDDAPALTFRSLIGRSKHKDVFASSSVNEEDASVYVAEEAEAKASVCALSHPVRNARIQNWNDLELLWDRVYKSLGIDETQHPVLFAEPPCSAKNVRERLAEVVFERFGAPSAFFAVQGVLSMYSTGRITGLVVDVGEGQVHTVPVFDGFAISNAVEMVHYGGGNVTDSLVRMLGENGISVSTSAERELVRRIKDEHSYASMDVDREAATFEPKILEFGQSGIRHEFGSGLIRCVEGLFQPVQFDSEEKGIGELVLSSISKCDIHTRGELQRSIICSGGTTAMEGFGARLKKELQELCPHGDFKVVEPRDRHNGVWAGASTFASFSVFPQLCITKEEYEENGAGFVHVKC